MTDNELLKIMETLTGWIYDPWSQAVGLNVAFTGVTESPKEICYMSPPNWYAFMGLMESYECKYLTTIEGKAQAYSAMDGFYI